MLLSRCGRRGKGSRYLHVVLYLGFTFLLTYKQDFAMEEKKKGCLGCSWKSIWIIFGIVLVLGVLSNIGKTIRERDQILSPSQAQSQEEVKKFTWEYFDVPDDMGFGTIHIAEIKSNNTVNFDSPYKGEQRATLKLRTHPRRGEGVIFSIEKGQFISGVYGTTVFVRFDDDAPKKFTAVELDDRDPTRLFIQGYKSFVASARKASKIRIEATFYNEGNRVFEFDSAGLAW